MPGDTLLLKASSGRAFDTQLAAATQLHVNRDKHAFGAFMKVQKLSESAHDDLNIARTAIDNYRDNLGKTTRGNISTTANATIQAVSKAIDRPSITKAEAVEAAVLANKLAVELRISNPPHRGWLLLLDDSAKNALTRSTFAR